MHAFDVLGDPVRRRILELLAESENHSGDIVEVIQNEPGIAQAAVSQHLRVLRDSGFASVRVDGPRRTYSVDVQPLQAVDARLDRFRSFWSRSSARSKRRSLGAKRSGRYGGTKIDEFLATEVRETIQEAYRPLGGVGLTEGAISSPERP